METVVELQIYSPRWGHSDTYTFEMAREQMKISMGPRSTTCTWRENLDPLWGGEQLHDILRNDSIYPPEIFQSLIEHAWKSWRNGELDDQGVRTELQVVVEWLNKITEAKPRTDFWRKYF